MKIDTEGAFLGPIEKFRLQFMGVSGSGRIATTTVIHSHIFIMSINCGRYQYRPEDITSNVPRSKREAFNFP